MKLAVLPVTCKNSPRVTALTKAWFEAALARVKAYFEHQSGGRAEFIYQVFDWTPLSFTTPEWSAEGTTVGDRVRPEAAALHHADFSGFTQFAIIVDHAESHLGATFGRDTLMAAQDFDPAILAHELGHVYGAGHTMLDSASGPIEYAGPFCIMGAEGGKYSFVDSSLLLPNEGGNANHATSGPGMSVPTMLSAGWFDLAKHAVKAPIYSDGTTGSTFRIQALDGAPPQGAQRPPTCCYVDAGDRYLIEYRIASASPWDAAVPASGAPGGWIVVYRMPIDGPITSLQVAAEVAMPGSGFPAGRYEPFYIFGAGPLRIYVAAVDPAGRTVDFRLSRKKGRPPNHQRPFEGFRPDFHLWSVDHGYQVISPASPMFDVLSKVAKLEDLRELTTVAGPRSQAGLKVAAEQQIAALRQAAAQVELQPDTRPAQSLMEAVTGMEQLLQGDAADMRRHLERLREIARSLGGVR
jgi:hypothetical protein